MNNYGYSITAKLINFLEIFIVLSKIITKFALSAILIAVFIMGKELNRLKVVLAEKRRTNKWLAQQLGKDPATVSKWCTNTSQPSLETLADIASNLEVDMKDLLQSTYKKQD